MREHDAFRGARRARRVDEGRQVVRCRLPRRGPKPLVRDLLGPCASSLYEVAPCLRAAWGVFQLVEDDDVEIAAQLPPRFEHLNDLFAGRHEDELGARIVQDVRNL